MRFDKFFILFLTTYISLIGCDKKDTEEVSEIPSLTISTQNETISEGNENSFLSFEITLSQPSSSLVTGIVTVFEGTAIAAQDFIRPVGLHFAIESGKVKYTAQIEILGDEEFESDETFTITLIDVIGSTSSDSLTITIVNDDSLPTPEPTPSLEGPTSPETYTGMQLIWRDEFDVSESLDSNWEQEFGDNWFNNELQTYTDKGRNASVADGNLIIEAREEASPYGGDNPYTSARLKTQDKFEFTYGRVDIRAAMPEGKGIWPALWTLGANIDQVSWPACGEIDVLEMIGGEGTGRGEDIAHNAMHWQGASEKGYESGSYVLPEGSMHGEYHVYSIIWTEESVSFLIDDVLRDTIDITSEDMSEFHEPHFFIINIAVGGDWPGSPDETTIFPQRMFVDYVRVFQNI
ncbi:MAG: glycoside hydrolase family 16 protein [Cyclobacteriaceae bacterium]